jgi:quinohemoprotein ethanol dehydrogenase
MRKAAKTWGGDFYKNGGGGAVWDGFAYDPEANLVYVGTGNAEPWVQKFRGAQNVDNLYTCSIIAVDLNTGQYKWHFQTTPNDNWDFDSVQQLMLLDLNINGKTRKVITQASKNGFFWVLDRVTGEYISGGPFVRVSWALKLDEKGRPVVNPEAYYDQEGISIYPTGGGGHNWAPMSFNPSTGLVYIPASYTTFPYQAAAEFKAGTTGYVRPPGETKIIGPVWGPEPPTKDSRGGITAYDPVKQKVAWSVDGGGGIGGGTVSTAANMLFQTINDGRFRALTADKGEILFEQQVGRTGMAPPITYESNGKQYVAFVGGLGRPANVNGSNDPKQADDPPMLYVYAVDGKAELPKAAAPPNNNKGKQQDNGKGPAPLPGGPAPEQRN